MRPPAVEVKGSRYEIERRLGEGGAGAVFLARDRETGDRVALKKLFGMDAKSVLRLKREFRALVDVAHPNLVKLYDMGRGDDCWFLTMEYLDGLDLTAYLSAEWQTLSRETIAQDYRRMLSTLQELAGAIHALHQTGMLHRDLKPSNVMVVDGRVVLLDFGLVRELNARAATVTEAGAVAGTPAYMAPEQIEGAALGTPADWYAYGAIVYEALSGVLPFDGSLRELLSNKLERDPTPVRDLAPDAPSWLSELCMGLLARAPAARPNGEEVLAAFARAAQPGPVAAPHTATDTPFTGEGESRSAAFFGRQLELSKLRQALSEAACGRAVAAHIRARSGAGKTALVEQFLNQLEMQGGRDVLVLRSRCYELEQMPFKALDGVLDALVRHLARLSDVEVAHVLPLDIGALSQLFPALQRLPAVKSLRSSAKLTRNAATERECAELALRQLLDRLARRQPIVMWIDDLQWGDLDSARILRSWLNEPPPAPLLFIFSYRSDEMTTSSCLSSLLKPAAESSEQPAAPHVVELNALATDDVRALCEQRLGTLADASPGLAERITREAQGSPFLASQLTALARTKLARGDADLDTLSIDTLVAQTGSLLSPEARRLLAVLAVAGRPMLPKSLLGAAGIRQNGRALVHTLRGLNLVRTRDIDGERTLEVYHDRVRERVQAALSSEQRKAIHGQLLVAAEHSGRADPEWLLSLALGAGREAQALPYALAAAERADASLAFEHAAELYRRCIAVSEPTQTAPLWSKLAVTLVHCGRGTKAADAYLEVAKRAPPDKALECKQLAASHLLRSGRFAQSERLIYDVLGQMGTPLPERDRAVLAAVVWERAKLKLRGMRYTPRPDADCALLAQHDACYGFGAGLLQYDVLRSALLRMRAMRSALDAGEPLRIVRAFCLAAMGTATEGSPRAGLEVDALLAHAATIAARLSEQAHGEVCAARAISAFMLHRPRAVLEPAAEADRLLRSGIDDPIGNYFRRGATHNVRLSSLYELGCLREANSELQKLVREAHASDNRCLLLTSSAVHVILEQAEDRASGGQQRLDELKTYLPRNRFGIAHVSHMNAVMYCACGSGQYAWADAYLDEMWPRFLRSPLSGSSSIGMNAYGARARLMLNRHASSHRTELVTDVRRVLKAITRKRSSHTAAAQRVEARLAIIAGDRRGAAALFRASAADWTDKGFLVEAARDAFAAGLLSGGDQGASEQRAALERLGKFGFVNPLNHLRSYVPELL